MNTFLQLPAERRRLAFQQVDEAMGLQAMLGPMFFGEVPALDEIMEVVGEFEKTFNATA